MTDNDTEDPAEPEEQPKPQMPEATSYEVRATRVFEVDFTERQLRSMMQQTGTESPEEAIEQAYLRQEMKHIEPEQKLLAADVQADGPSDKEAE